VQPRPKPSPTKQSRVDEAMQSTQSAAPPLSYDDYDDEIAAPVPVPEERKVGKLGKVWDLQKESTEVVKKEAPEVHRLPKGAWKEAEPQEQVQPRPKPSPTKQSRVSPSKSKVATSDEPLTRPSQSVSSMMSKPIAGHDMDEEMLHDRQQQIALDSAKAFEKSQEALIPRDPTKKQSMNLDDEERQEESRCDVSRQDWEQLSLSHVDKSLVAVGSVGNMWEEILSPNRETNHSLHEKSKSLSNVLSQLPVGKVNTEWKRIPSEEFLSNNSISNSNIVHSDIYKDMHESDNSQVINGKLKGTEWLPQKTSKSKTNKTKTTKSISPLKTKMKTERNEEPDYHRRSSETLLDLQMKHSVKDAIQFHNDLSQTIDHQNSKKKRSAIAKKSLLDKLKNKNNKNNINKLVNKNNNTDNTLSSHNHRDGNSNHHQDGQVSKAEKHHRDMAAVVGLVNRLVGTFDAQKNQAIHQQNKSHSVVDKNDSGGIIRRDVKLKPGGPRRAKIDAALALAATRTKQRLRSSSSKSKHQQLLENGENNDNNDTEYKKNNGQNLAMTKQFKSHEIELLENLFRLQESNKTDGSVSSRNHNYTHSQIDMKEFASAMSDPKVADLVRRVVTENAPSSSSSNYLEQNQLVLHNTNNQNNQNQNEELSNLSVEALFDSETIRHAAAVTLQALARRVQTQRKYPRILFKPSEFSRTKL